MESKKSNAPIVMAEEYWANSHFSVARYWGGINVFGYEYQIVNKQGITIFELSNKNSKHYVGDENMAINPGEPADLCRVDWIHVYRAEGRDAFMEYLKKDRTLEEANEYIKNLKC